MPTHALLPFEQSPRVVVLRIGVIVSCRNRAPFESPASVSDTTPEYSDRKRSEQSVPDVKSSFQYLYLPPRLIEVLCVISIGSQVYRQKV